MNPMKLVQVKPMLDAFQARHPKFIQFFGYAGQNLNEDSLLEISITTAEGKKTVTNMRITAEDLELMEKMREVMQ